MTGNPNTRVQYRTDNMYGSPVFVGRRTGAHLDHTREKLARLGRDLVIIQGAYNTSVAASAGTHDKDACLDVYIPGMDWWAQQRFLREQGWAAWYRYPPLFGSHIHMITVGYGTAPVGVYVPGQVADYYNHRNGLAGHAYDGSWHPDRIADTIYRFTVEDAMTPEDFHQIQRMLDNQRDRILKGVSGRGQDSKARDQRMLKVLADGFRDLDAAVDGATDEVKAKVNTARETTVARFRQVADELAAE